MKSAYLLVSIIPLAAACASPTFLSETVGPGPLNPRAGDHAAGYLRVFTAREKVSEGFGEGANPGHYHYTDYRVYDQSGKMVKYVGNLVGEYDPAPARIALASGHYVVKARAKDYLEVQVPVFIVSGHTTNVHLDGHWSPPLEASRNNLVIAPDGRPVGWRAPAGNLAPKPPGDPAGNAS